MDPDEVESAGINTHDRLTDTTGSSGGGGGGGGGNASWACHLLRRGCGLARKAAIAGAAATAAPVVAPPLIVLSAAGVALSVPFAAYLASLAATNYLTAALLRACQSTSQPYRHQEYDDDVEQEFLDASEEYDYGQDARAFGHFNTDETAQGEEDESDTSLLLPRIHGFSEASAAADAEEDVEGEFTVRESSQDSYTSNRGDGTEEHTSVEKMEVLPRRLFSDEDSQVQTMGEDGLSVLDPGKSENWGEKEGDLLYSEYREEGGRTTEQNKSSKETLSQGFYFPESRVPASGDKDNVIQEKGEGEFSAQNSGQYSLLSNPESENEQGMTMERKKSTEEMPPADFVAFESPAPLFHGEDKESDTSQLLSLDLDVSEEPVPAFADKVGGEFSSVQESGLQSHTSNRGEETEEHTPMREREPTGKEVLPLGIGVSSSAKPLFSDEDNLVQEKGEGGFSVHISGPKSFQSMNRDKEEGDKSTHENKSTNEKLSQGFNFHEPPVRTLGGDDDNAVQEMGGAFFVQNLGQQSFQSNDWNEKEEKDGKTTEENKSTEETVSQAFYLPESRVPSSGDKGNVVRQTGEDEFSAQNSGQYSLLSNPQSENEQGMTMEEEKKSTKEMPLPDFVASESPAPLFHGEDKESDISPLFSLDHDVSEEPVPKFADKVGGEFSSVQESGLESYTPNRGEETVEHAPMRERESTGKEVLPRDIGVSSSAKPLFSDEDNLVQEKGEGGFPVHNSGQTSFQSKNRDEEEESGKSTQENKSTKEKLSQGFNFPELPVRTQGGDDDNTVQEMGGAFFVQNSGRQLFQSNNWKEKEEEDGRTTEENKSTEETVSQAFYLPESRVPASGDKGNVVRQKGQGEFSAHNLAPDSLPSNTRDEKEQDITIEENKSTEEMPSRDFVVSESSVPVFRGEDDMVQSKEGFDVTVQGVVEEANSNTDHDMGEVDNVQVEIIAIAAPESEVLPPSYLVARDSPADLVTGEAGDVYIDIAAAIEPESEVLHPSNLTTSESPADPDTREIVDVQVDIVAAAVPESEVLPLSSLGALESQAVAETAHVGEVENEKGMEIDIKKSTENMPPGDSFISESSVQVLGAEDDVAQSKERFEVAVQEVVEEADSNTNLVMGEVADVQVEIIAIAAPESEVLPPSNLVGHDSPADPVAGEIVHVQVNTVAAAVTGSEVLHPSDFATSDKPSDPVTGESVDMEVDVVAAVAPGNEMLPLSSLPAYESQAVVETAHVGEIIEITVMEDIVRDFDDVNKGVSFVPVPSVHDGEDVMSSGSTPYLSTVEEEMNEAFGSRVVAGAEADYTEEQMREQIDTIRTITGYSAVPSPTLEGELGGLYMFVGVEPAVGSSDTSDHLMELNAKLRFLKSIIGVD